MSNAKQTNILRTTCDLVIREIDYLQNQSTSGPVYLPVIASDETEVLVDVVNYLLCSVLLLHSVTCWLEVTGIVVSY